MNLSWNRVKWSQVHCFVSAHNIHIKAYAGIGFWGEQNWQFPVEWPWTPVSSLKWLNCWWWELQKISTAVRWCYVFYKVNNNIWLNIGGVLVSSLTQKTILGTQRISYPPCPKYEFYWIPSFKVCHCATQAPEWCLPRIGISSAIVTASNLVMLKNDFSFLV